VIFPVVQAVTANIVATLQEVQRAHGFETDFDVRLATFDPEPSSTLDPEHSAECLMEITGMDPMDDQAMGRAEFSLMFEVTLLVRRSTSSTMPLHDRMLVAAADAERALMSDVSRGGNALNTTLSGANVIADIDDGYYGAVLQFRSHVRTLIDEPYQTQ
jgi:hypothetical protein